MPPERERPREAPGPLPCSASGPRSPARPGLDVREPRPRRYALVQYFLADEKRRLAKHKLYIALRVPILHYVQMRSASRTDGSPDGAAPDDAEAGPPAEPSANFRPKKSIVAAVERLRVQYERHTEDNGSLHAFGLARAVRELGRSVSHEQVKYMADFMVPGIGDLEFSRFVEFVVDFERLFPASIGSTHRSLYVLPRSEQTDVYFRCLFPVLIVMNLVLVVTAEDSKDTFLRRFLFESLCVAWIPYFLTFLLFCFVLGFQAVYLKYTEQLARALEQNGKQAPSAAAKVADPNASTDGQGQLRSLFEDE